MPSNLQVAVDNYAITLTWHGNDSLRYNIYSSVDYPVDTGNPTHLLHAYCADTSYTISIPSLTQTRHYAITAIDRYGNESLPVQWKDDRVQIEPKKAPVGN